jgi:pyridoxamine 5'-phosphate oxidase family protein
VRGAAEARTAGGAEIGKRLGASFDFDPAFILVRPTRIVSWGIDGSSYEVSARDAVRAG